MWLLIGGARAHLRVGIQHDGLREVVLDRVV